jgi:probable O-glycosylation ligase (exosortase A-associated)
VEFVRRRTGDGGGEVLAFVALVGFAISTYASIAHLIPALGALRPALASALLALASITIGRLAAGRPFSLDPPRGLFLIGLCVWALLSMIWTRAPEVTRPMVFELFKLAAIYLTVVNVVNSTARLSRLCFVIVICALAPAFGTIDRWRSGTDLIDGFRASWEGVYADPNHLSMTLVALVPLALFFALSKRGLWQRAVAGVSAVSCVAAIVFTHSRGGALGLACSVGVWVLLGQKRVRAGLVALALLVALVVFAPSSFWERTETLGRFERDLSAMGRVFAWEITADISRDRPMTGVGLGAFQSAWGDYAPREARGISLVAHNIFLSVVGELGLLGFALLLGFVGSGLGGAFKVWRALSRERSVAASSDETLLGITRALIAGSAGFLLCDLFSGYLISAHFFFFWALLACCERVQARSAVLATASEATPARAREALR